MPEPKTTRRTTLASLAAAGGFGMLGTGTAAADTDSSEMLYLPVLRERVKSARMDNGEWEKNLASFQPEVDGTLQLPTEELQALSEYTNFYVSVQGTARFLRGQEEAEGTFTVAEAPNGPTVEGSDVCVRPRGTEGRLTDDEKFIEFKGPKAPYEELESVEVHQDVVKGDFVGGTITLWREVEPENL